MCIFKKSQSKQYVNILLAFFVMSVLNMSIQLPAHAAMQMSMGPSQAVMNHSDMQHDMQQDMQNCECPPVLCDTVEAQQDQYKQSNQQFSSSDTFVFYPVLVITKNDTLHQLSAISFQYHTIQYHQNTPPPISLTTELQI